MSPSQKTLGEPIVQVKSKAAFQVQYEDAKAKARMAFKKVKRELEERAAGGEIITVGWQGQGQLSCVIVGRHHQRPEEGD